MAGSTSSALLSAPPLSRQRQAGKQDWEQMTTAVLKNRLLNLTRGQFLKTATSPSFIQLVQSIRTSSRSLTATAALPAAGLVRASSRRYRRNLHP